MRIYIYIYMVVSMLFTHTKQFTAEKGRGARVVPRPSQCERADYPHIPSENEI